MKDKTIMENKEYHGKILHGNYSHALKTHVTENISRLNAFEKTRMPVIPYLSAWHREKNTMWYEFAGTRFTDLMGCPAPDLADVFRKSIVERRVYDYQGENHARINKQTLKQSDLTGSRKGLRAQGEKKGLVEAIYKVRLAGGAVVWLKDQATVTAFQQDQVHISSGCLTIVTKEMEAEEALIKTQKMLKEKAHALNLARKIQEENAARLSSAIKEVEAARNEAEKANKAKSEFLAVISHEIRNPMNGIVGTCDLIMADDLSRQQKEYLEIIRSSAFSLLGLINDILDFSKIEAGRLEFQEVGFDVRDVVEEVSDIFLEMISRKNLELIVDVDPGLPARVKADPMRLRQVLINLTSNALKFTRKGEIIIRVEPVRRDTALTELAFRVTDTGIGIAPEHFDQLFESFTQVNDEKNREYGGTGLGLAICRQIVEMMNGTIGVDSTPGQGSTFYFTIPFKSADPPGEDRPRIPAVFSRYHALVVQDNRSGRQALKQVLESWGFTVTACDAGLQAAGLWDLEQKNIRFDLMIMDMGSKDRKDQQISDKLISLAGSAGLSVALTRMGRNDDLGRGRELGFARSLTKPVKQSVLLDLLKKKFGSVAGTGPASEKETVSGKPFSNTRVLLVEDNAINLKIGSEMLRMAGVDVDTAGNGIEAIEKVHKNPYAAVLIDIQMPHLDGIEASRIIRQQFSRTRLPIIAMSAHAKSDNWKACLEAGINDYILKPVSRNVLFTALKNQIGPGYHIPVPEPGSRPPADTAIPLPDTDDLPGLDVREGIERLGGATHIYADILTDFCKEYAGFQKKFKGFLTRSDYRGAAELSHSLKGASGNISAMVLFESAKALEQACWQKREDEMRQLLGPVQSDYETVCRSAEQFVALIKSKKRDEKKTTPAAKAGAGKKQNLTDLTRSLMNSLDQCDPVLSEILIQKMEPLADRAWQNKMDLLVHAVKNYQFDDAKNCLKSIMDTIQSRVADNRDFFDKTAAMAQTGNKTHENNQ
jgi:two-component system, sensor histidine kinase and response regulator